MFPATLTRDNGHIRRILIVTLTTLMLFATLAIAPGPTANSAAATAEEKITICHAAGQAGTTKFVTLTLSYDAVYGEGGHFFENGTPRAGHEDDYLGACNPPTLTLVKIVVGGDLKATDFPVFIDGEKKVWGVTYTLESDSYVASETQQADYTTVGWGGDCDENGNVTLGEGEDFTCTITNTFVEESPDPQLTLVKNVINDNDGTTGASAWTLSATGAGGFSDTGTPNTGDTKATLGPEDVTAGVTYALSESDISGYTVSSDWSCIGDGVFDPDADTIVLALDEAATCEITNNDIPPESDLARLKLVKVVSGGTAGPDGWTLYAATSVEGRTDLNFDNLGDEGVLEDVYAGVAYKLSESSGPARYTASSWSCVIGGGDQISEAAADPVILSNGMITLEPFEEVTCTITNRYRPPTDSDDPAIDIEKATNGVDADAPALGPPIDPGSTVTWSYVVKNTGDVTVTDIVVTDDNGTPADSTDDFGVKCPETTLAAGEAMDCDSVTGTAKEGPYGNVATVTGSYGSRTVTDKDPSHYKGVPASVVGGTAQLGDTVWLDVNKNGVQDSGEVGYNGADVILKDADGNVVGTLTTATGAWVGFYSFVGLDAGTYTAMLDLSTIGTYKVSTATAFTVTLAEGDEYLDADFGLYEDTTPPTTVPTTTPPEETLPTTGADTDGLAMLAASLLILGALAVLTTRKRRIEDQ